MAFLASFTAELVAGSQTNILLTDTSTDPDPALTGRTIYLYKADGELLTPAISWAIGDSTKTIDVLTTDLSLSMVVIWASSSPEPDGVYTYTLLKTFTPYIDAFINSLVQSIAADQNIRRDTNFYNNLSVLYTEKDNAINATDFNQQGSAQDAIDRANFMIDNRQMYF